MSWISFLLSPKGRVGRFDFILATLAFFALLLLYAGLAASLAPRPHAEATVMIGLGVLPLAWPYQMVRIKRCHDLGLSGRLLLLGLVPLLEPFLLLALILVPGTEGTNRYGPDPRPGAALAARAR